MQIIPKNHILLNSAQEIDDICKPLAEHFGVTFFGFVRAFNDNSRLHLTNHIGSAEYFYDNYHRYRQQSTVQTDSNFSSGHFLCNNLPENEKLIYDDVRNYFDLDHILMIIEENIDYRDFYFIGTDSSNYKIVSLYLSHLDLIYRFIDYFKETAKNLIVESHEHKLILPDYTITEAGGFNFSHEKIAAFNQSISLPFSHMVDGVQLTKRQADCLFYLTRGMTSKQIAKQLQLSPKTIEHYLINVKAKLDCNNRAELITKGLKLVRH